MNRLAFSTLPCEGWSLDAMIAYAKECGFGGMELREGEAWGLSVEWSREKRTAVWEQFGAAGIRVTDIGSGVSFTGGSGDAAQAVHLRKVVRLAGDLGAEGVRLFLGHFIVRRDDPVPGILWAELVATIQEACDDAAACGVRIWIETHNEFATGRSLRELLDEVKRDNCAVIYDIIHPLEEGESPAETVRLLGAQCVHVHIKDGVPQRDPMLQSWKYTKVGEGQVPVSGIVELLEQAGYAGFYSLEWETKWRPELQVPGCGPTEVFPAYVAFMRGLLRDSARDQEREDAG